MLKSSLIYLLFASNICLPSPIIVPQNLNDWTILQESDVWVACTKKDNVQWCKAEKVLPFNLEKIADIIENKANYPNVFKRIEETIILSKDIVHVILDMPFPFDNRDYIVQYISEKSPIEYNYTFTAYNEMEIPERNNYVRLINAGGRWTLVPMKDGNTKVSYLWNGELRGDFPDWGLERAWKVQGTEVLNWLNEALK
ncbi:MAG: hypothetical protein CMG69_00635 [Candidatus Marinimicrobia bacterium]|nr:hypothetical protein [Candidatus Neomarinimicrobiota bacterium]|tara:strand:- start:90377 stop:90970 length:594 start_codon:yes stop_codon:yes gene_type:complete